MSSLLIEFRQYGIGTPALTESMRKAQYVKSRKDLATFKDAFETSPKWLERNPDILPGTGPVTA
jgi:hypothetical protein